MNFSENVNCNLLVPTATESNSVTGPSKFANRISAPFKKSSIFKKGYSKLLFFLAKLKTFLSSIKSPKAKILTSCSFFSSNAKLAELFSKFLLTAIPALKFFDSFFGAIVLKNTENTENKTTAPTKNAAANKKYFFFISMLLSNFRLINFPFFKFQLFAFVPLLNRPNIADNPGINFAGLLNNAFWASEMFA